MGFNFGGLQKLKGITTPWPLLHNTETELKNSPTAPIASVYILGYRFQNFRSSPLRAVLFWMCRDVFILFLEKVRFVVLVSSSIFSSLLFLNFTIIYIDMRSFSYPLKHLQVCNEFHFSLWRNFGMSWSQKIYVL